jgi:hypothetical protein
VFVAELELREYQKGILHYVQITGALMAFKMRAGGGVGGIGIYCTCDGRGECEYINLAKALHI